MVPLTISSPPSPSSHHVRMTSARRMLRRLTSFTTVSARWDSASEVSSPREILSSSLPATSPMDSSSSWTSLPSTDLTWEIGLMSMSPEAESANALSPFGSSASAGVAPSRRVVTAVTAPTAAAPASLFVFTVVLTPHSSFDDHERAKRDLGQLLQCVVGDPDAAVALGLAERARLGPGVDGDGSRAAAEAVQRRAVHPEREEHRRVGLVRVAERPEQEGASRRGGRVGRADPHRPLVDDPPLLFEHQRALVEVD